MTFPLRLIALTFAARRMFVGAELTGHLRSSCRPPFGANPVNSPQIWPQTDWWRGFRSAELDRLIAAAQAGSFDIQAAIARVRQADAQVRISGAALLPTVDGLGQCRLQPQLRAAEPGETAAASSTPAASASALRSVTSWISGAACAPPRKRRRRA